MTHRGVLIAIALVLTNVACDANESLGTQAFLHEDGPAHSLALCQDGADNDHDGLTDCDDPDCAGFFVCSGAQRPDASVEDKGREEDGTDAAGDASDKPTCFDDTDCAPLRGEFCVDSVCRVPDDYTIAPTPALYAAMGMVLGAGIPDESTAVGSVIGRFCGIDARQNGPTPDAAFGRGTWGWNYQSTELGSRYLCARRGARSCTVPRLRAGAWYDATDEPLLGALGRYPNGGEAPPRPGDVIVFDVPPMGHVAIVTAALIGEEVGLVEVLEQGLFESSHAYAISVVDGHYTIPSALGWLRPSDDVVGCGSSGHIDALSVIAAPSALQRSSSPEGRLLMIDARALVAGGLSSVDLLLPNRVTLYHRVIASSPDSTQFLATVPIPPSLTGEQLLSLEVHAVASAPATRSGVVDRLAVRLGPDVVDPLPAVFESVGAEHHVPACILAAIADVASRWYQGYEDRDRIGLMGIRRADLAAAAAQVGVSGPDVLVATHDAALHVRAAAALMASWADDSPGLAYDARNAVEAWWPVVARFFGPGLDGDLASSNAVFRVYDRLARGVPGRVPRVPGLDLAALGHVSSRPATPEELLVREVTPEDAALTPVTPPLHLRYFAPNASLPRHACAGACAGDACEAAVCEPNVAITCIDGAPFSTDSCGETGDPAPPCELDDNPCTLDVCVSDGCAHPDAPDGSPCSASDTTLADTCSAGVCQPSTDADHDGFYFDREPFDCPGHDDDPYIYPGAPERLDVRDNDCDGLSDEDGLVRFTRYKRIWAANDWEHRYSATPLPAPWEEENERWIALYPLDICAPGPYQPADGCCPSPSLGDVVIDLWTGDVPCDAVDEAAVGFTLIGLQQCVGVYASGQHISLLLQEDSGEYSDYHQLSTFHCERIGYIPGPAAAFAMPSAKVIHRLRSVFGDGGVSDNLWTAAPDEEDGAIYPWNTTAFSVPAAH